MLVIQYSQIVNWIEQFFLPFCRVSGFFLALPLINSSIVSFKIRIILALAVSVLVFKVVPTISVYDTFSILNMIELVKQIIFGALLGFMVQLLFQIGVIGGQIIAMQNGLGMATLVDPVNGFNIVVIGQIYLIMSYITFFSVNGHLILIKILADSFESFPIYSTFDFDSIFSIISLASWMFKSAVLIALPVIFALLTVSISFGIVTRLSPQLNIFSVGFPLNIILGLAIIWISIHAFSNQYEKFVLENATLIFNSVMNFKR